MSQELKFIFTPLSHLLKFCGYCSHDPNRGTRQVAFVAILNLGTLQRCKGRGLSRISSRIHAETMNHHCSSFRIVWTKYKSNKMTLVINTTAYVHESVFYWISWTKNNTLSLHAICWVSNVFLYSHGLFPWQKSTCPREGLPLPFENSFCFKRSWLQSRPNFSNSSLGEGNVIFDALDDWYSEAQPISGEELPFLYPRWNQIWLLFFLNSTSAPNHHALEEWIYLNKQRSYCRFFGSPKKFVCFVLLMVQKSGKLASWGG